MSYKAPNVNKPRVKRKATRIMDVASLREFKKQYPEHKNITLTEFNAILRQFNTNIVENVSIDRNGISLPELIGQVLVMSFPRSKKKKAINFGESNKTGVKTYHRNWNTDDRMAKIVYFTGSHSIRYSHLWGFTATRSFKLKVSEIYKKLWAKFIYVDGKSISINSILK